MIGLGGAGVEGRTDLVMVCEMISSSSILSSAGAVQKSSLAPVSLCVFEKWYAPPPCGPEARSQELRSLRS